MLAYLDALLAALSARDPAEINRLLGHPLACILTREARGEAERTAEGRAHALPLRLLQLRHQTANLLGARAHSPGAAFLPRRAAAWSASPARQVSTARHQIELPLMT